MNYRLAVLTHGRMSTLDETIDSFRANVTPAPAGTFIYADGIWTSLQREWTLRRQDGYLFRSGPVARGFCHATRALWDWVSEPGADYVFWLEHDFLFLRPVDLAPIARILDANLNDLAQVALCRGPANEAETAAGGLVASRPGEFEPTGDGWLRHRSYFTTTPSLMRRAFMAANPFLYDGDPSCEGRYGAGLVERGYSFGLWGDGEEWVQHVGIRAGFGY